MKTFEPLAPASSPASPPPLPDAPDSSAPPSSADHLDAIQVGDELPGGAELDEAPIGAAPGPVVLDKDQFWNLFRGCFNAASAVSAMVPIAGRNEPLHSLAVAEGDAGARAASDALHDIAEETPSLRWLIEPGSVWLQRAVVIGAFAFGKVTAVRAEVAARVPPPPRRPSPAGAETSSPAGAGVAANLAGFPGVAA